MPQSSRSRYEPGAEPVPGYRLIRFLGKGAFGEVWEASGPGETRVALKFIKLEGKEGPKEFRAIRMMQRVHDARLVKIHAVWLRDVKSGELLADEVFEHGLPQGPRRHLELVIAMNLGSKNLLDRVQECKHNGQRGIPLPELMGYLRNVARALDHLNQPIHELDGQRVAIHHCDIKPQNILLVGDGVQVCDFGLARFTVADANELTKSVNRGGGFSPAYAAPEVLRGEKPNSFTDQYSLAISYYELRTGSLPFPASFNRQEVTDAHLKARLDFRLIDNEDETAVLRRATSLVPTDRYPSCWEFVQNLQMATRQREVSLSNNLEPGDRVGNGYTLDQVVGACGRDSLWNAQAPGGGKALVAARHLVGLTRDAIDWEAVRMASVFQHPALLELTSVWALRAGKQPITDSNIFEACRAGNAWKLLVAYKTSQRETLAQFVSKHPNVRARDLLLWLKPIADCLDQMNRSQRVQFQNIRPSTILVKPSDPSHSVLFDVGYCRRVEGDEMKVQERDWIPQHPFIARDWFEDRLTRWSDQYSLAATYVALRKGRSLEALDERLSADRLRDRVLQGPTWGSPLGYHEEQVLRKATHIDPRKRFGSCGELWKKLEEAVGTDLRGGAPAAGPAPTSGQRNASADASAKSPSGPSPVSGKPQQPAPQAKPQPAAAVAPVPAKNAPAAAPGGGVKEHWRGAPAAGGPAAVQGTLAAPSDTDVQAGGEVDTASSPPPEPVRVVASAPPPPPSPVPRDVSNPGGAMAAADPVPTAPRPQDAAPNYASSIARSGLRPLTPGTEVSKDCWLERSLGRFPADGCDEQWVARGQADRKVLLTIRDLPPKQVEAIDLAALQILRGAERRNLHLSNLRAYWFLDAYDKTLRNEEIITGLSLGSARRVVLGTRHSPETLASRAEQVRARGQGLELAPLLRWMQQLAAGVDFLNTDQFLVGDRRWMIQHLNLHPYNVLFNEDGDIRLQPSAYIRVLDGDYASVAAGFVQETPFSAPELAQGRFSRWTDQFSLAAMYVYLRLGLDWKSPEIVRTPPAVWMHALQPQERLVLSRALSAEPSQRYSSSTDFFQNLEASLQFEEVQKQYSARKTPPEAPPPPPAPLPALAPVKVEPRTESAPAASAAPSPSVATPAADAYDPLAAVLAVAALDAAEAGLRNTPGVAAPAPQAAAAAAHGGPSSGMAGAGPPRPPGMAPPPNLQPPNLQPQGPGGPQGYPPGFRPPGPPPGSYPYPGVQGPPGPYGPPRFVGPFQGPPPGMGPPGMPSNQGAPFGPGTPFGPGVQNAPGPASAGGGPATGQAGVDPRGSVASEGTTSGMFQQSLPPRPANAPPGGPPSGGPQGPYPPRFPMPPGGPMPGGPPPGRFPMPMPQGGPPRGYPGPPPGYPGGPPPGYNGPPPGYPGGPPPGFPGGPPPGFQGPPPGYNGPPPGFPGGPPPGYNGPPPGFPGGPQGPGPMGPGSMGAGPPGQGPGPGQPNAGPPGGPQGAPNGGPPMRPPGGSYPGPGPQGPGPQGGGPYPLPGPGRPFPGPLPPGMVMMMGPNGPFPAYPPPGMPGGPPPGMRPGPPAPVGAAPAPPPDGEADPLRKEP